MRRAPLVCALALGLGLVAVPFIFGMFDRAPRGAVMLDEFRPFMTDETITAFERYLAEMDAAETETQGDLRAFLAESGVVPDAGFDQEFPLVATFSEEWPAIDEDMSGLLDDIGDNVENYDAVDALPPFTLFPWFFVAPGLLIAGVAGFALVRRSTGSAARWALVGLGVGLIAAPAVFQMFTRAPKGGEMIDRFRPIMERDRVQRIQGYFVTIGATEGTLRAQALPLAQEQGGLREPDLDERFPAIRELNRDWQTIVADDTGFAAMTGAMSDNVDNYEAVDALPPFSLFPWFFVIPGVLVAGLALISRRPEPALATVPVTTVRTLEPSVPQRSTR
ncbi:MAG: hypothetical protein ACR2IR_06810 [Acidimicrobiia bacterium]